MIEWLKNEWTTLASIYTEDHNLISKFWIEIESKYSGTNRYYHNLSHMYDMLTQAENIKDAIVDFDDFRFAIWYHDIIYKSTTSNNEAKSADLAKNRLKSLNINENRVENIQKLILSTQKHEMILNSNKDNAFLLDIDLSILGSDWQDYENYVNRIRKEYAIYPDFIHKKGRKKAMLHFLERERIFYSEIYFNTYEQQARRNIKTEIDHFLK